MQGEGGFGRDDRVAPGEERLSTEDIARPQTEPAEPPPLDDPTPDSDPGRAEPRSRITDAPGDRRPPAHEPAGSGQEDAAVPLLGSREAEELRSRWSEIQQGFVDDPQESVRAADGLVAEVMQLLASTFADHKERLEGQWHQGNEVATEDLRIALRQYRSFFDRLLTT
ncbi:hypothetical protein OG735_38700 [Streptomyces sp. NBC_01210]|uniref:hypothetical protein n=1 Tax=Streptomyces sp. NBC_01210 TaxID=2903774 RepID=UPI002E16177D|nr:hypothetical protein OG735_38700 [Streptomyces sp. NBC_01210]